MPIYKGSGGTLNAADIGATPDNFGAGNAGKFLNISSSGSVVPADPPSGGSSGGSALDYRKFGETPCAYTGENARKIKLEAASATVRVSGFTVADLNHMGTVTSNGVETFDATNGYGFRLTSDAAGNKYIGGTITGVVVGDTYRIILICRSGVDPSGGGHYVQAIVNSKSVKTLKSQYDATNDCYTMMFTATSATPAIYLYPFMTNGAGYVPAVDDEIVIEDFFVNRVSTELDFFGHDPVSDASYSVTGSAEIDAFPRMFFDSAAEVSVSAALNLQVATVNGRKPDKNGNVSLLLSGLDGDEAVAFGDSITGTCNPPGFTWPDVLGKLTGMKVWNAGVGGSTMHIRTTAFQEQNGQTNRWDYVAAPGMVEASVTGDWSHQMALIDDSTFDMRDRMAYMLPYVTQINWQKVKRVAFAFGANDITTDSAYSIIDDPSDKYNTRTYLGAFRTSVEMLMTAYPHIRIIVLLPIYRCWLDKTNNYAFLEDSRTKLFADDHLYTDWGDALAECCSKEYGIPYVDGHLLGINKINRSTFFPPNEGTHPSIEGSAQIARLMAGAMKYYFGG